jgi:Aspartyl protease
MIVLLAKIDGYEIDLALDTGASHTVIDLSILLLSGSDLGNSIGSEEHETANGVVTAFSFKIAEFEVLGESRRNFVVGAYDYFQSGIVTDIDGVLGLDFFQNRTFCIDMEKKEISF